MSRAEKPQPPPNPTLYVGSPRARVISTMWTTPEGRAARSAHAKAFGLHLLGSAAMSKKAMLASPDARFWPRVEKTATCWLWTGSKVPDGYGAVMFRAKKWSTHRLSWTLANGPIPKGLYVLHRCDVRNCVNPAHLFLGTNDDNMRDMAAKGRAPSSRKTHCPKGHPYDDANTVRIQTKKGPERVCRTCRTASSYRAYLIRSGRAVSQ